MGRWHVCVCQVVGDIMRDAAYHGDTGMIQQLLMRGVNADASCTRVSVTNRCDRNKYISRHTKRAIECHRAECVRGFLV